LQNPSAKWKNICGGGGGGGCEVEQGGIRCDGCWCWGGTTKDPAWLKLGLVVTDWSPLAAAAVMASSSWAQLIILVGVEVVVTGESRPWAPISASGGGANMLRTWLVGAGRAGAATERRGAGGMARSTVAVGVVDVAGVMEMLGLLSSEGLTTGVAPATTVFADPPASPVAVASMSTWM